MYRVALVNMPFAAADIPSIALAQLRSMVDRELPGEASCEVLHLNLEFVNYLGPQFYEIISGSVQANTSGLGDWFFSLTAFPEKPDNPEAYLVRHFSEHRAQLDAFRRQLTEKRRGAGTFLDSLIDLYRLDQYSLVGLTSMFSQNVANIALARKLKERNPGIVICMGGANCEAPMGQVLVRNVPWLDFVFSGPALRSFPALVRHLMRGEGAECHKIRGVLSRQKLGLQVLGGGKEIGEELDITVDVPLDYDDYFAALDQKVPRGANLRPRLPFETSRGCWWGERSHCTFCGLNGATMKYRALPPESALGLLHGLFDRYASRVAIFESVDNILPREYLTDVLPRLETPEGVALFYEIKADLKEREMAALSRAKVTRIQPGIEALSTTTLKLMRKGTTSFQNLKFLKNCGRYEIKAFWNLLIGFPGEPEEVYRKYYDDLPLLTHLQPPSGVYPIRFDRYSPYHMQAREYGLKLKPGKFYEMIYPFPKEEFEDLAYFFADEDYKASYITSTAKWLAKLRERVAVWQVRWNRRDQRLKPELVVKRRHGSPVVYDSRSGAAVERELSPAGWRVLGLLNDQHRVPRLAEKLGLPADEVAAEVALLKQHGLLFEEDGYLLSLVHKPEEEAIFLPAEPAVGFERASVA